MAVLLVLLALRVTGVGGDWSGDGSVPGLPIAEAHQSGPTEELVGLIVEPRCHAALGTAIKVPHPPSASSSFFFHQAKLSFYAVRCPISGQYWRAQPRQTTTFTFHS